MANQIITGLAKATALNGTEAIWAIQNGTDVQVSTSQLTAYQITNPSFSKINLYGSITTSAKIGALSYGALTYSDTNNFASFETSANSYAQVIVQNANSGTVASSDVVVSNDIGTATTYYGNFGINSSGFTGSGSFNLPSATYLTSTSGELAIGTTTNNAIHFVVSNASTDSMLINPANGVVINNYGSVINQGTGGATFNIAAGSSAGASVLQFGYGGLAGGGTITANTWSIATGEGGLPNDMVISTGAAGTGGTGGLYLRSNGNVGAGTGWTSSNLPSCSLTAYGSFGANPPIVYSSTTVSVSASARSAIFNPSGTATVTLPAAASYPGMEIMCKNISANAINSASSNVVPLNSATPGTVILAASAGSACILVSDGTNWQIMR